MNTIQSNKIKALIRNPDTQVFIEKSNELGYPVYAICVLDDPDFWLHAFKKKKTALKYCRRMNLKIYDEKSENKSKTKIS